MPAPSATRAKSASSLAQALGQVACGAALLEAVRKGDVAEVAAPAPETKPAKPARPRPR